jgi:hypothetical protein
VKEFSLVALFGLIYLWKVFIGDSVQRGGIMVFKVIAARYYVPTCT